MTPGRKNVKETMITGELLAEQSPELMQNLKLSSHQSDRRERERTK